MWPPFPRIHQVGGEGLPSSRERGGRSEMTSKRLWGVLATALTAVAVLATQLPAAAHHKEGHNQGKPEPGPTTSPSPTPSPSPSATPRPGQESARPCTNAALVTSSAELTCTAVSSDGSVEVTGWLVSETQYSICDDWFHSGCLYQQTEPPSLQVKIDTGSGPTWVCIGQRETSAPIKTCQRSVEVTPGVPFTCIAKADYDWPNNSWPSSSGPRETLFGVACS